MAPYCVTEGDESEPSSSASNSTTSPQDFWEEEFPSEGPLPPISLPDRLPFDRSLPRLLARVCGTDDVHTVASVKLKVITQEICLQRLYVYMPSLVELDLTGSVMNSLRDLGCGLSKLSVLRVGRCSLDSLDGLFGLTTVEELYAPENNITCVGYCAALPALRILDLQKNNVSNLRQIEYLSMCPALQQLTLTDCPATSAANYRAAVGAMCPKLKLLDGVLLVNTGPEKCNKEKELSSEDDDSGDTALTVVTESPLGNEIESFVAENIFKKKHLPVNGRLQRPRTSGVSNAREREEKCLRRTRPATAHAQPSRSEVYDLDEGGLITDTPSRLTSGGIVCGNLAAALRDQRKQKSAWTLLATPDKKVTPVPDVVVHNEINKVDNEKELTEVELLEASRKWREAYNEFRTEHRQKWKSEETEDLLLS